MCFKRKKIQRLLVFLISLMIFVFIGVDSSCNANKSEIVNNDSIVKDKPQEANSVPMTIWYDRRWGWGRYENLRNITLSGIFTHVLLIGLHEYDVPDYVSHPRLQKAVEICKKNNVKIIWARFLYPDHKLRDFRLETIYDPSYYIKKIKRVKQEAQLMEADLVGLESEPCCDSPLKPMKGREFSKEDYDKLTAAIDIAVEIAGKVDVILPSGRASGRGLYRATHQMAKYAIAEHTYYDLPKRNIKQIRKNLPFDIFGVWVGVSKENPIHTHLPLFTPKEILIRRDLWENETGLFVYSSQPDEVSRVFYELSLEDPNKWRQDK